ncbi:MAG: PD-(D/E)XK nuclease family protein [Vulcanimicrobiota bacterium]
MSWQQFLERLTGKRSLTRLARWASLQRLLRQQPPEPYRELVHFPGFTVSLENSLRLARLYDLPAPLDLRLPPDFDEIDLLASTWDEAWLRQMQALLVVGLELPNALQQKLLQRACQLIPNHLVHRPGTGPRAPVKTLSAPDETLECQEVVRHLWLAAERGQRWDEMAVLLRQPEVYRAALQSALRRARIPFYLAETAQLPHPQGRALLCLLECARENLSALRFAEYLSLAQHLPTPSGWEELLGAAWIIRSPQRWRKRLRGLGQERRQQIAQLERDQPDSPQIGQYQDQLRQLQELEAFALPIIDRLAGWQSPRSWGEWLWEIRQLAGQALPDWEAISEKLQELEPLSEIPEVSLTEVVITLTPLLSQLAVPPKGHRYGQVLVGHLDEARGRNLALVILPGMAERRFPAPIRPDPFVGEQFLQQQLKDERLAFELALGCADQVVAIYPRQDQEKGRPLLPSSYFLELSRQDYQQAIQQAAAGARMLPAWPAPQDPNQAVDGPEHALAWYLKLREKPDQSSANFLLKLSPFLAQAMRSRIRQSRPGWTRADGRVALPCPERHWPERRPYSPSSLQKFAECPYKFWLYTGYRLNPREEPQELQEMDPLTRGNFVHAVHARLVWRGPADLNTQLQRLAEESARVAEEYAELLNPLVPRIFADEVAMLTQEMSEWLRRVYEPDWEARYAELAFNLSGDLERDPASQPDPAEVGHGYRLRGSIDRVEVHSQGSLRLVDLKTGRSRPSQDFRLGKGEALQPVLYALAVQAALNAPVLESRLDYMTTRGNFAQLKLTAIEEASQLLWQALETLSQAMKAGNLAAFPKADGCRLCDYQAVCGPQAQLRARHKGAGPATEGAEFWRSLP